MPQINGIDERHPDSDERRRGFHSIRRPSNWIIISGAMLILLALGSAVLLQREDAIEESREQIHRSRSLAGVLSLALGSDITGQELSRVDRILEYATRNREIKAGAVMDNSGTIIAHTDLSMRGQSIQAELNKLSPSLSMLPESDSPDLAAALFKSMDGRLLLHPMVGAEGMKGTVALLLPGTQSALISPGVLRFFLPAGLILLAFIIVGRTVSRVAQKPVRDIMEMLSRTLEMKESESGLTAQVRPERIEEYYGRMEKAVSRVGTLVKSKDELFIRNRLLGYEKKKIAEVLAAFPDGLIVTNASRKVVFANARALGLLGLPVDDSDGSALDKSPEFHRLVHEVEKNGRAFLPAEGPTGKSQILFGRVPMMSRDNQSNGTLYTLRDVSAQQAAQRTQAEFLSQVTHELKAPLHTIVTFVEEIAENDNLTPVERREFCNTLNSETHRMALLISNLFQLSRIQLGNLSVRFAFLKPASLIRDQAESLRMQAESIGQTLRVQVPDNLPAILGDKDLLGVTFTNLISNAIKYTPEMGQISVLVAAEDSGITIDVQDTGIGIPEEELELVFDRFHRSGQEEVQEKPGSGLGLSLVKEIVEVHGGKVSVTSEVGKGSRFRIWLPVREVGASMNSVEPEKRSHENAGEAAWKA